MSRRLLPLLLIAVLLVAPLPVHAQDTITVFNDQPALEFPDRLTFQARFQNDRPIEKVVLEYGVEQWTCGTVIAKAFPDITPGKDVSAKWTWEMKQSGSQPPGSRIWWRWHLFDDQGKEIVTNRKEVVWLDDRHDWQTASGDNINLHWYDGGASFGPELHQSAVKSLGELARVTGLRTDKPIDLYIYGNTQDMRDAVLFEPGWTGGLAYADHNIVIIGIAPDQLDWGKRTEAHELTHVLVGQLTFSCLSDIPTWLQEGLAVYGEGGPDKPSQELFDNAVADDTLLSVRALSGGFSEDPAKADISYSESYSIVNYLIETFPQEKMLAFLQALRDGATTNQALHAVYGFGIDGLEDAWRAAIAAKPRAATGSTPTPTAAPTMVPTFVPVSIAGSQATVPANPIATSTVVAVAQVATVVPTAPVAASAIEAATLSSSSASWIASGVITVIVLGTIGGVLIYRRKQRTNA